MTLTRWQRPELWGLSPVRRVATLRDDLDNLFNLAFGRLGESPADTDRGDQLLEGWFPAVDMYEDKDTLLVKAELPGMRK